MEQWRVKTLSAGKPLSGLIGWPGGSSAVEQWKSKLQLNAGGPFRDRKSVDHNVGSCQWCSRAVENQSSQRKQASRDMNVLDQAQRISGSRKLIKVIFNWNRR